MLKASGSFTSYSADSMNGLRQCLNLSNEERSWDVAVIIPAYNAAPYIEQCVQSVVEQTHAPKEIVIIDDGSTDGTAAKLCKWDTRITVIRQKRAGTPTARNRGVAATTAPWLAFLDADDWWEPDRLRLLLAHAAPGVGFLYNDKIKFFHTGKYAQAHCSYDSTTAESPLEVLSRRFFASPSTAILCRKTFSICGGFGTDPSLTDGDYELWIRAAMRTRFCHVAIPLTWQRIHSDSVTASKSQHALALAKIKPLINCEEEIRQGLSLSRRQYSRLIATRHFQHAIAVFREGAPVSAIRLILSGFRWLLER